MTTGPLRVGGLHCSAPLLPFSLPLVSTVATAQTKVRSLFQVLFSEFIRQRKPKYAVGVTQVSLRSIIRSLLLEYDLRSLLK